MLCFALQTAKRAKKKRKEQTEIVRRMRTKGDRATSQWEEGKRKRGKRDREGWGKELTSEEQGETEEPWENSEQTPK